MPNHSIFNERPESQERMLKIFSVMGYDFVSRSDAEEFRGYKSKVIFESILKSFLLKQKFEYKN